MVLALCNSISTNELFQKEDIYFFTEDATINAFRFPANWSIPSNIKVHFSRNRDARSFENAILWLDDDARTAQTEPYLEIRLAPGNLRTTTLLRQWIRDVKF